MKVLFRFDAARWLSAACADLSSQGLDIVLCSEQDDACYLAHLRDAEALWHVLRPVAAEPLATAARLRLIQKIGVGVNTIDLETAKRRNIAVCNMPGTNSRAVAEHALALLLAVLRKVVLLDGETRAGRGWSWPVDWQGGLGEIGGKTIGLVAFGAVPRLLTPALLAMGARVIYTGRRPYPDVDLPFVSKDELLARADVVSLHLPLEESTRLWLDAAAIRAMKPGAVVVNVARGGLIDEAALAAALNTGHIAAAGLDVFTVEPAGGDHPLLRLPNVVVTPHVAWLTRQTLERSLAVAVENSLRLARGEPLLHRVA